MEKIDTNASDGSVQEIAVNDRNPIGTDQVGQPAVTANDREIPADHTASSRLTDKQEASDTPAKIQMGMVSVALLRPYAKNKDIYENRDDPLFTESIRKNGVLTPLAVTTEGEVLGGNRRLLEAQRLKILEVPVIVVLCSTEDEKMLRVLDDNVYRAKTNEEIAREFTTRLEIEARAAATRKAGAGKKAKEQQSEEGKTLAPPADKRGKARDKAAKELNLSGVTAEKGRKVLEAVAKARAKGAPETAEDLLVMLNDKGFHSAYERAKALKLIVPSAPKVPKEKGAAKTKVQTPTKPGSDNLGAHLAAADAGEVVHAADGEEDTDDAIVATYIKAASKLGDVMAEKLTIDQRKNLLRAHDDAQEWFAYNDEALHDER